MRAPSGLGRTFAPFAAGALAMVAVTAGAADGVPTTVYKCAQPNAAVLYADYPCTGSTDVDIKRDVVDPAAVGRLQRAQAQYEQTAARRRANEDMAALRREESNARLRALQAAAADAEPTMATPATTYVPAFGFLAPKVHHATKERRGHRHADHGAVAKSRVPAGLQHPQ